MKIRAGFVTNSSSTGFIVVTDGMHPLLFLHGYEMLPDMDSVIEKYIEITSYSDSSRVRQYLLDNKSFDAKVRDLVKSITKHMKHPCFYFVYEETGLIRDMFCDDQWKDPAVSFSKMFDIYCLFLGRL